LIRALAQADIPELERVQNAVLPGSLPTLFGPRFFRLFYESLMADPRFLGRGFFWESSLGGFLTYTTDTAGMLGGAFRSRFAEYLWAVGMGVLTRPAALSATLKLLPGFFVPGSQPGSEVKAELLSFGVLPEYRRGSSLYLQHRVHVAAELLHGAFEDLRRKGALKVKVYIQTEDANASVNEFYRKEGFQCVGRVRRFGVPCNYCTRDL
jgi:ribosomal protein S18 acetylase RimI-like enzyme